MSAEAPARLRMGTKLAFGVGAAAEASVWIAFNTWNFLYYTHVLGLSGTLCGPGGRQIHEVDAGQEQNEHRYCADEVDVGDAAVVGVSSLPKF